MDAAAAAGKGNEADQIGVGEVSLLAAGIGRNAIITEARLDSQELALLKAMGLCRNARVRLCRIGEPCIVAIRCGCGSMCRIGLARPLAERIFVRIPADAA